MTQSNSKKSPPIKFAIYSRKSIFTGKGDSVENQIEMCKRKILEKYPHVNPKEDIFIYEDEGFSGTDTNRPKFIEMLKDAREKKFSCLYFYKLDRISRSVADLSKLVDELSAFKIDLCSVDMEYDTTSPMGNMVLQMTSVFAEFERRIIAERVRDNVHELAKSGRWLGGAVPTGYISKSIAQEDHFGKNRKSFKLELVREEAEIVKVIFQKYLELKSLSKVRTYCLDKNVKTKNGKVYSATTIKIILQNPTYCVADTDSYRYFLEKEAEITFAPEDFTGKYGIMPFNRTKEGNYTTDQEREKEWIIAIGKHKPIISSKDWIAVQKLLLKNNDKSISRQRSHNALLSGIMHCAKCGSRMRAKQNKRRTKDGAFKYYYICRKKDESTVTHCNCKNAPGNETDYIVCKLVKSFTENKETLINALKEGKEKALSTNNSLKFEIETVEKQIRNHEKEIENLVNNLTKMQSEKAISLVEEKISKISNERNSMIKQLEELKKRNQASLSETDFDSLLNHLMRFDSLFDTMTIEEKREVLQEVIRKIVWDEKHLHIYLFASDDNDPIVFAPIYNKNMDGLQPKKEPFSIGRFLYL